MAAASFDSVVIIATNSGFQNRCNYALMVAAINVVAELNTTASHQQRVNYAKIVLAGGANLLQVALAVLTNTTIAAEAVSATTPDFAIPDGDIQFAVNSLFNALAGVTT
jgi:hypothetical protein